MESKSTPAVLLPPESRQDVKNWPVEHFGHSMPFLPPGVWPRPNSGSLVEESGNAGQLGMGGNAGVLKLSGCMKPTGSINPAGGRDRPFMWPAPADCGKDFYIGSLEQGSAVERDRMRCTWKEHIVWQMS